MGISNLNVRVWGDEASTDKTALLIHGLAGSSLTWRYFAKDLVQKGYRVIAPDLRGHGRSVRSEHYSLQEWSEDILNMGINPDLMIGHSIGGLIAANVQNVLRAKNLILVDPVFHLPKNEIMLRRIQDGFATVMFSKYASAQQRSHKVKDKNWLRIELISINQWDVHSVRALRPDKASIVRCLMGRENVFLMRAKGSYVLPPRVMKKTFNKNIRLAYFGDGGHNIHISNYDLFKENVFEFLNEADSNLSTSSSLLYPNTDNEIDTRFPTFAPSVEILSV